MNYVPQMTKRKIGEVEIIDLKGDFVGPWAIRGKEEIQQFVEREKPKNLLINLKSVDTIDSLGVRAIVDNLSIEFKCGVISGNYSVNEMFTRTETKSGVRFFKDEEEVIQHFAEELVSEKDHRPLIEERRTYTRLKTALPLQFHYIQEDTKENIVFHAIVTNLSEGGLYAEYLDVDDIPENASQLDPYDLKMLDLTIKFPDEEEIDAKGKVLHVNKEAGQLGIGIQFYEITPEAQAKIQHFIKGFGENS